MLNGARPVLQASRHPNCFLTDVTLRVFILKTSLSISRSQFIILHSWGSRVLPQLFRIHLIVSAIYLSDFPVYLPLPVVVLLTGLPSSRRLTFQFSSNFTKAWRTELRLANPWSSMDVPHTVRTLTGNWRLLTTRRSGGLVCVNFQVLQTNLTISWNKARLFVRCVLTPSQSRSRGLSSMNQKVPNSATLHSTSSYSLLYLYRYIIPCLLQFCLVGSLR